MNREQLLAELGVLLLRRGEQLLLDHIREMSAAAVRRQICDVETHARIVWLISIPD